MVFTVRRLCQADLLDLVAIHMSALPGDLLPALGPKVLLRHYNHCLSAANSPRICLLGAFQSGHLVGFVQGNFAPLSMSHILGAGFVFSLIRLLFFRPMVLLNGVIQVLHGQVVDPRSLDVAFFAVAPPFQGLGVGRLLLSSLSELAIDHSLDYLLTKTANQRLMGFYQRLFDAEVLYSFSGCGVKFTFLRWLAVSSLVA